jgi:GTP cyclohydrolase IA
MIQEMANVLTDLGYDLSQEALKRTPERFVRFLQEFSPTKKEPKLTFFDAPQVAGMIVVSGIPVISLCEHHLAPFTGTATIGYLPGKRIVGLSKFARVVEFFSHRLQTQEHLTYQIAEFLQNKLECSGLGVIVKCEHSCMAVRGVRVHDVWTLTTELRGHFQTSDRVRAEFMAYYHHS